MARFANIRTAYVFIVLIICLGMSANAFAAADNTTTTVTAPTNNQHVAFGAGFSFIASVHDTTPGPNADPGGTFYFYADATAISTTTCLNTGGTALGSIAAVNVDATHDSGTLNIANVSAVVSVGTHTIAACFLSSNTGNSGWKTSASGVSAVNLIVDAAPTSTTTISASAGNTVIGQSVSFTAHVTPSGGSTGMMVDGYVMFIAHSSTCASPTFVGMASLTPANNAATTAVFQTASLPAGAQSLDACYLGNANFASSDSQGGTAATVTVGTRGSLTTITAPTGTPTIGVNVPTTVTVQVADNGGTGTPGIASGTSLTNARSHHASALLPSGDVLVIGGQNTSTGAAMAGSEIYHLGAWSAGLSLNVARSGHTATFLQDGTVVIIGGSTAANGATSGVEPSIEVYDLVKGTVSQITPTYSGSTAARTNHTATLLSNGTILITGGMLLNGNTAVNTTEIYTPSTHTFSDGPASLLQARANHTATLLPNGKVLIAGGGPTGNQGAEIYDPVGATSTYSASMMAHERNAHTATLQPNGLVVLAGGYDQTNTLQNNFEYYDYQNDVFTAGGSLSPLGAVQGHTARLMGDGTVLLVGGSSSLSATNGSGAVAIATLAYDPQGVVTVTSDSGGGGTLDTVGACSALALNGTGTVTCNSTLTLKAVNTNPHNLNASYSDTLTTTIHAGSSTAAPTTVNAKKSITITAVTDSRAYDGTTASAATPLQTDVSQLGTDTIFSLTQSFDTKDAGAGKLLTPTVVIHNSLNADVTSSYVIVANTATGSITKRAITVTAATDSKTYDGTTSSGVTPTITTGTLGTGDTATLTQTFDTKDVGTSKTLTPVVVIKDGASTDVTAIDYTVTLATNTTGAVAKRAITVTAATDTKIYNGTTSSAGVPTITTGTLGTGDTATLTQTFDTKDVGTAKTLTPVAVIKDGSSTDVTALDYTVTLTADTTGVVNKRPITVTATTDSKTYDGTTTSAPLPTITTGSLGTGDTMTASQTFDTKDVATGKTLTPVAVIKDGSNADVTATDYTVTLATNTTGAVTKRVITVTAATDTKTYDGTTSSVGVPTLTAGTLAAGDTATYTQVFSTKTAGTSKTLVPTAVIKDGTATDVTALDYTITYVNDTTGVVNTRAITITAATDTKTYDGTTASTGAPTLTTGTLGTGDTATYSQTFDTKHVGTGKTLTPSAVIKDAGSVDVTASYAITAATNSTGVVTTRPITITAASDSRAYNGTTSSTGLPTITTGTLGTGDTATLTQTYDTKHIGTSKTLTPAAVIKDAGSVDVTADYAVSVVPNTTGVITTRAITVTPAAASRVYDGTVASAGVPTVTSGSLGTGDTGVFTQTYDTKHVGSGKTFTATGTVVDSGSVDVTADYAITFAPAPTGTITQRPITVTAATDTKTYDATTTSAGIPTVTAGSLAAGDIGTFSQVFATASAGTGKTLTPSGTIKDSGSVDVTADYAITFANNLTGAITGKAITVTANAATKVYDQTTSSTVLPSITAGALASGDLATLSETYDTKNVGTAKTLTPLVVIMNGATDVTADYIITYVSNTSGVVTQLPITGSITASNKVYDGMTAATIATRTLVGVISGDAVTYTGGTATFSDKNVGTAKTVSATGLGLTGGDAGNYSVNSTASTTANITQAALTITATGTNKVYDGGTVATVTFGDNRVTGDVLTETGSASFADKNVGTAKPVSVTGIVLSGTDSGNYSYNATTGTTANITPAPLNVKAVDQSKVLGAIVDFTLAANNKFTPTGLQPGDTLTAVTLTSTGSGIAATTGTYPIVVTPLASGNFAGTVTLTNYTITYSTGTLTVGKQDSRMSVVVSQTVAPVASNPAGAVYSFSVTVSPTTPGTVTVPTGTVTFTDGSTTLGTTGQLSTSATAQLANITLAPGSTHKIIATYNGDTNFKGSSAPPSTSPTFEVDIAVASAPAAIVAGATAAPTVSVTYKGNPTASGTLATADVQPNCTVQSQSGVVVVPALLSCTATLDKTLNPGDTGTLTITIKTTAGTVTASVPNNTHPGSLRALYALSFGMPAVVFIGLAGPLGAIGRKKTYRGKLVTWFGLVLLCALLSMSIGCGGGFTNPNNLGPVTIQRTVPGNYTAIVTYTDSSANKQVLATLPFTVN